MAGPLDAGGRSIGTFIQNITTQQTDPRPQVRQWGREMQRSFAAA